MIREPFRNHKFITLSRIKFRDSQINFEITQKSHVLFHSDSWPWLDPACIHFAACQLRILVTCTPCVLSPIATCILSSTQCRIPHGGTCTYTQNKKLSRVCVSANSPDENADTETQANKFIRKKMTCIRTHAADLAAKTSHTQARARCWFSCDKNQLGHTRAYTDSITNEKSDIRTFKGTADLAANTVRHRDRQTYLR